MLIIIPPSETKRPSPEHGSAIDLAGLSFPELAPIRDRVLEAVVQTSGRPDALRRLMVRLSMADEVARNIALATLPTRLASDLYSGPLHAGLDAAGFSPAAAARAREALVVTSALWGALRLDDRIPTYRLHMNSRLVGIDRLDATWQARLPDVLAQAAGPDGVIVDLRSPIYQAAGRPRGLGARTVTLSVARASEGGRRIGDVVGKRVRGQVAHWLLESGTDPADPGELALVLGERWPVELREPARVDSSWTLTLRASD